VGTPLDGGSKMVGGPLWAAICGAASCGILEEKMEGRVTANGAVWAH